MLKEDGVPTIFAYNANKQPSKPKASTLGEEAATKKKLCDDAFMHNELVRNFEIEINTKATQIFQSKKQMTPVSTQTELNPTSTCKVNIKRNIKRKSLATAVLFSANTF